MKAYEVTCPWCGTALLAYGVEVGLVLGCPNIGGGCGRKSRIYAGVKIPLQMRVVRIREDQ